MRGIVALQVIGSAAGALADPARPVQVPSLGPGSGH